MNLNVWNDLWNSNHGPNISAYRVLLNIDIAWDSWAAIDKRLKLCWIDTVLYVRHDIRSIKLNQSRNMHGLV